MDATKTTSPKGNANASEKKPKSRNKPSEEKSAASVAAKNSKSSTTGNNNSGAAAVSNASAAANNAPAAANNAPAAANNAPAAANNASAAANNVPATASNVSANNAPATSNNSSVDPKDVPSISNSIPPLLTQSPQERSKQAREKFQALLQSLNANKGDQDKLEFKDLLRREQNGVKSSVSTAPSSQPQGSVKGQVSVNHRSQMRVMPMGSVNPRMVPDYSARNLRAFVEKAIKDRKIFAVLGVYPGIKNALKRRGWVEKTGRINLIRNSVPPKAESMIIPEVETDAQWIARNLKDVAPTFVWACRRDNIDWNNMQRDQIVNHFPRAWFTTKVGLSACLQQMHWYAESGLTETFFPRCYRICLDDERSAFIEDYRLTACMSYLRYFVEAYEHRGVTYFVDPLSRITPLSIDFASRQVGNYIRMRRHEDIDWLLPPNFMSQHWDAFLHQYYLVVHEKRKIRFESEDEVTAKYELAKKTLTRIPQYWPQHQLDGVINMWICKPGARSRGSGIVIMNSLEKILDLLKHGNIRETNWVVQKYLERPMLIYKTKFDMRQWFIISDWSPLTIWFYKESYVRFCSKPFVLEDFHESIHLCNNAVQCRYQNAEGRDASLPAENMWDSHTLQSYFKRIGRPDLWNKIYSGMKQAIIGVLLASQETVEAKRGCFELYGADFMMSEDGTPWLIEINSGPCMAATTSITARMCAQCLEDTVKVAVDYRMNKNADTGNFEMIYRQSLPAVTVHQVTGHDIVIHGKRVTRDPDWGAQNAINTRLATIKRSAFYASPTPNPVEPTNKGLHSIRSQEQNLNFSDVLARLREKNAQLFKAYLASTQAHALGLTPGIAPVNHIERSMTSTLLQRMRVLNKIHQERQQIKESDPEALEKAKPKSPKGKQNRDSSITINKYYEETRKKFGMKGFQKEEEGMDVVGTAVGSMIARK